MMRNQSRTAERMCWRSRIGFTCNAVSSPRQNEFDTRSHTVGAPEPAAELLLTSRSPGRERCPTGGRRNWLAKSAVSESLSLNDVAQAGRAVHPFQTGDVR